jgi:DNA-directed RNA polymerase subunit RPC12/RpoP
MTSYISHCEKCGRNIDKLFNEEIRFVKCIACGNRMFMPFGVVQTYFTTGREVEA